MRGWLSPFLVGLTGCSLFARAPALAAPRATTLPTLRVTPGDLDVRAVLGDLPARAARLGAGVPSMVRADEATEGDWLGAFVDVPKGVCLLSYARASSTIDDVDMAVFADDGTQLAVDEARDVHPTVLLCGVLPSRVYVAAHVVDGEGFAVVAAQIVPRERAVIVGRALGARGAADEGARPADALPGLDDAVAAHRGTLGGTWETVKRVALAVDARAPTLVAMPVEADACVDAVVVPDADVPALDVEALDGDGRMIARAHDGSGARTLTLCSPLAMAGTLSVRPHTGRGLVAMVLARAHGDVVRDLTVRPEIAWTSATLPLEAARRARDAMLAESGYEPARTSISGSLVLGRRVAVPVDLKGLGAPCARLDVVAGAPLGLVSASAWDDGGALLASDEGASSLALFACARGPVRVELETRGRPGPFAVTVRPERWRDSVLGAHSLAASRLMGRAASGPGRLLEGTRAPVRSTALDAAHEVTWTESVPAGKCARVTVGVEGEGTGVDLRAIDAGDGEELDRGEGALATVVRACARAEARNVRFELRVSAGRVEALAGEQTTAE